MMRRKTLLAALGCLTLFTPALHAQEEAAENRKILLARFLPYRNEVNEAFALDLGRRIASALTNSKYELIASDSADLKTNLARGKRENFHLLVAGYYRRNAVGNIALYGQIYNPHTGYIIDAIAVSDPLEHIRELDVKVDEKELRENDENRLAEFVRKLVLRIRANRSRKEMTENINQNVRELDIGRDIAFPIRKVDVQEEAKTVFRFIEDQVVVTASKQQTKIKDAPAAVYVITEKMIRTRGYRTLADALHDVPGFDFQHTYGVYPDLIHQRGLIGTMQRTLLYVDGIPDNNIFENAMLGGTVRFPLHNVERIEIVSGPASALYGANAFNGIINIITREGNTNPGAHADVTYGSYESRFRNQGAGGSVSSRGRTEGSSPIHYSVGLFYFKSDGPNFAGISKLDRPNWGRTEENPNYDYRFDPFYALEKQLCGGLLCNYNEPAVGYYSSPFYNNSKEDTYNITARFVWGAFRFQIINWQYLQGEGTWGSGAQWIDGEERGLESKKWDERNNYRRLAILMGLINNGERGFPGSAWDVRSNTVMLGHTGEIARELSLDTEVLVRHTEILNSSRDAYQNTLGPAAYYQPGDWSLEKNYDRPDYAYQLEERLQWDPARRFSTTAGIAVKQVTAAKDYGSPDRYIYNNFAGYLQQLFIPVESLRLTAGFRHDLISSWGSANTPRFSAVWSPTKESTFKLLLGSAFREPSAEELYSFTPQRKPNPDLKPEFLRSAEIGAGYRFFKNYYFSLQAYYSSITNLILEVQTEDYATIQERDPKGGNPWNQYKNVGRARILGAEAEASLQFTAKFSVNINYTYDRGWYYQLPSTLQISPSTEGRPLDNIMNDLYLAAYTEFTGKTTIINKGEIPNIAPHKAFLGITYLVTPSFSTYLGANWIDVRRTVATNPEKTVPGYLMIKLNVRKEDFLMKGMYIQIHVNNATRRQFFDPGIRVADGNFYPTMIPIEKRNVWITVGHAF